jgi:hypothetical protein
MALNGLAHIIERNSRHAPTHHIATAHVAKCRAYRKGCSPMVRRQMAVDLQRVAFEMSVRLIRENGYARIPSVLFVGAKLYCIFNVINRSINGVHESHVSPFLQDVARHAGQQNPCFNAVRAINIFLKGVLIVVMTYPNRYQNHAATVASGISVTSMREIRADVVRCSIRWVEIVSNELGRAGLVEVTPSG